MTIKQQGGIFGRNPTFNNVEVDGTATLDNIAASDKLRVTASENPAAYIEFENTFQNAGIVSQAGLLLGVNSSVQTNYAGVIGTESAANANGVELDFYANNGSAMVHVARARGSKNFEIMDGNLIVANGQGIDFSATSGTGTSELFDDYEEGTYTVTLYDASSGGNASATTTTGYYTKVGRQVTVWFSDLNNINTAGMTSGNPLYVSLPFTSSNTVKSAGSCILDNFNLGSNVQSGLTINPNSARFLFRSSKSAASAAFLTVGAITSGTSDILALSVSYNV